MSDPWSQVHDANGMKGRPISLHSWEMAGAADTHFSVRQMAGASRSTHSKTSASSCVSNALLRFWPDQLRNNSSKCSRLSHLLHPPRCRGGAIQNNKRQLLSGPESKPCCIVCHLCYVLHGWAGQSVLHAAVSPLQGRTNQHLADMRGTCCDTRCVLQHVELRSMPNRGKRPE